MDVSSWLAEQGLGHQAQAFAENGIGGDVLRDLTDADLKELGLNLGDRKRLLKAIATLDVGPTQDRAGAAEPSAPSVVLREAERRQLTVMFVDLVGSTALSAELDPEDMREVIRRYQNTVAGEITRFEGYVAKYMGDGVLAYFGYPRAHEDEAERAVRAGLALVETVRGLSTPTGEPLAARVGMATGVVVVGDLVGEGVAQEEAVVGDTPNLAARLQGVAQPGQVVIAERTRRLVGARFELVDLGLQTLKGLAAPVEAFAVLGERAAQSRFEAHSGQVLPMVGRDQELALLLERWAQAKAGEGQGVLLVGEAGIGKSRITRALLDALADEPHTRIRYQCSAYHTDSALWPVIQQLGHAAGLAANDALEARLDKLEALLRQAGAGALDAAPLIADLIGLDGAPRYGRLNLTPQTQRARTLAALVDQLLGLARKQPVLVVLEDAHWLDPTTLEMIGHALDRIADARALVLLTSRPDQQPELAGHPHMTRLTLNRLSRGGAEAIVARLSGGRPLPAKVIDAIIARTDGVPLYVEELTKTILEIGETSIPASLHDSLMARIDRIPEVKEVAQIAACIGREFDFSLLAAVADKAEPDLRASLDKLAAAEIVFRRGTPPQVRYVFKHALVQDAAYQSLLKSRRQQVHARIAATLEQQFPDIAGAEPELLARHYSDARLAEPAAGYWLEAGRRATKHSADKEALAHFEAGLTQVATLPDGRTRYEIELDLQTAMGMTLIAVTGPGSPEIEATYSRSLTLCAQLDDPARLRGALWGQAVAVYIRGEIERSLDLTVEIVKLAEQASDEVMIVVCLRALGTLRQMLGDFGSARENLESAIRLYRPDDHASLALRYGHDPLAAGQSSLSVVVWALGYPDQALHLSRQSVANAKKIEHPHTLALALNYAGWIRHFLRDPAGLQSLAEDLIALSSEHNFPVWLATAGVLRGNALASQGAATEGVAMIQKGLENYRSLGGMLTLPYLLSLLAEAQTQTNQTEAALHRINDALTIARDGDDRWWMSELQRRQGELLLASTGRSEEAEECMKNAIATAVGQQAKSLELRAATSLARMWQAQDKRQEAYDLLLPIYGWFTEGFDTVDLKDAKALLDELA